MFFFFLILALVTARLLAEVLFLTVQGPGFCRVFYHTSVPRAAVIFLAVCLYLCPSSKWSVQNNLLDLIKKKKGHRINFSACSMVEMVFVNGDFCSMTYILKATICHLFFPVLASLPFSFPGFANTWFSFVELMLLMFCCFHIMPSCGMSLTSCR